MSLFALLVATLLGCGGSDDSPDKPKVERRAKTAPPADRALEADPIEVSATRMVQKLNVRKPEPRCEEVDAISVNSDPVAAYAHIIATVTEPPFVPIRAATCMLVGHPKGAEAHAVAWVGDENKTTLMLVVLGRLDSMPADVSGRIAKAALAGPHAEVARGRLSRARSPHLKQLANGK